MGSCGAMKTSPTAWSRTAILAERGWFLILSATALLACCGGPSGPPDSSPAPQSGQDVLADLGDTGQASDAGAPGLVVKLDVLLVVRARPSMVRVQHQLALGATAFVQALQAGIAKGGSAQLDLRAAVVSTDQLPRKEGGAWLYAGQPGKGGVAPGIASVETRYKPCQTDGDCSVSSCEPVPSGANVHSAMCKQASGGCIDYPGLSGGSWSCAGLAEPALTGNCSVRTVCRRKCASDADCDVGGKAAAGQVKYQCAMANFMLGCIATPATDGCGQDFTPYLAGDSLAKLNCAVSVGYGLGSASPREGGLGAALAALEPSSPSCGACGTQGCACLAKDFVRSDAHLLVIVVSNEDDCSLSPALEAKLKGFASDPANLTAEFNKLWPHEEFRQCGLMDDPTSGNTALAEGYCNWLKWQDKVAGKPQRTCPEDCALAGLTSQQAAQCKAKSAETMAVVKAQFGLLSAGRELADWRLASTKEISARLMALKPALHGAPKLLLATLVGASIAEGAQARQLDAAAYYGQRLIEAANMEPVGSAVCVSPYGPLSLGARYAAASDALGENGYLQNLCDPAGVAAALGNIANWASERILAGQ